jgi:RimJ/RimL family protein N-acetyltransferase
MPSVLHVAGLTAVRVEAGHLDGLCRLDGDQRVMQTLGGPRSRETTETHLRFDIEQWEEHGFGMYALVSDAEGVVGRVGLRSKVLDAKPEVEVGYSLVPGLWGRGIVTTAVERIVGLAALTCLAGSVVATVGADNTASVRVLEKAGFVSERPVERAGEAMLLYRRSLRLDPWGEGPGVITADGCPVELYAALPADGQAAGLIHRRLPAGASVLDLGCGTGRIGEPLAAMGHPVVGVDNSPDMLARLRCVEPVLAEIGGLRLDRRFDAVVAASNLVNHVDPAFRQQVLEVAAAHLAPSGHVLVEWQPPGSLDRWIPGETIRGAAGDVDTQLRVHARYRDLLAATVTYRHQERRWSQHFTTRRLKVDDLGRTMADAGLVLQGLFGPSESWVAAVPAG